MKKEKFFRGLEYLDRNLVEKLYQLHEKTDKKMEEKIVEMQKKYNLDRKVVKDILEEGNDIACDFYENKTGKIKDLLIEIKKQSEKRLTEV